MADGGSTFTIGIEAESVGVDATASEVNRLAAALEATDKVATPFDNAIKAARTNLAKVSEASAEAADKLKGAETHFARLERKALSAATKLTRAAEAGKDTAKLEAAAKLAADAVAEQAEKCDKAKAAARKAADAERELAQSLKVLEKGAIAAAKAQAEQATAAAKAAEQAKKAAESEAAAKVKAAAEQAAMDAKLAAQDKAARAQATADRIAAHEKAVATWRANVAIQQKAAEDAVKAQADAEAKIADARKKGSDAARQSMKQAAQFAAVAAAALIAFGVAVVGATAKLIKLAIASDKVQQKRLDKILKKASENARSLFERVKVKGLVDAVGSVAKLLDKSTVSGSALRKLFARILQPIVDGVAKAAPLLKVMFKGAIVGALKLAIMAVRLRNALLRAIPKEIRDKIREATEGMDAAEAAFQAGQVVIAALGVAALVVVAAIGALAIILGVTVAAAYGLVTAVADIGSALGEMGAAAIAAGSDFVAGLVESISNGVGAVAAAAKKLAVGAINAVKSTLGIASASKVMKGFGINTTEGVTVGVEQGTPDVVSAVESMSSDMVDAAEPVGSTRAGAGSAQAGMVNSRTNVGGATFNITINAPSGDAEDIKRTLDDWLVRTIEGQALAIGGGEVPE